MLKQIRYICTTARVRDKITCNIGVAQTIITYYVHILQGTRISE